MPSTISSSDEPNDDPKDKVDPDHYRTTIFTLWNSGYHFEALKLAFRNKIVDCPPTRNLVAALARYRKLLVIGHGSASKTFTATAFNLLKWWSSCSDSTFILTSATIKSLRHRAWADLKLLMRDVAVPMPGMIMASQYMVRQDKMDEKHVIMAVSGEDEASVTKIQGAHPKNLNLMVDEGDNSYNVAIWKAVANLGTSGEFQIVGLANPMDRNSVFGMNCEPVGGWDSIDINSSYEWESRSGYHVLRLDGLKSPNILAGEVVYPFLLSPGGITDIVTEFGENSPNYFTYVRAWFPDIGSINTMFSGSLVTQMEKQEMKFYADATPVASCDPSLGGGNRCVMMIGRAGLLADDPRKGCVEVTKLIYVRHRDPSLPVTHDFAEQMKEICLEHGVEPENFAIGCSTADLGIVDYLRQFWSKDIYAIDPAGKPGKRKILQEDTRSPEDRFDRKLTEMAWITREWAKTGQLAIREVNRNLRIQMEARRWGNTSDNKLKLETKVEMKKRGLNSPDEFDCAMNLCTMVRDKYGDLDATNLSFDPLLRKNPFDKKKVTSNRDDFEPSYKTDGVLSHKTSEQMDAGDFEDDRMSVDDAE